MGIAYIFLDISQLHDDPLLISFERALTKPKFELSCQIGVVDHFLTSQTLAWRKCKARGRPFGCFDVLMHRQRTVDPLDDKQGVHVPSRRGGGQA